MVLIIVITLLLINWCGTKLYIDWSGNITKIYKLVSFIILANIWFLILRYFVDIENGFSINVILGLILNSMIPLYFWIKYLIKDN